MARKQHVIVGLGIAGAEAAQSLRANDPEANIRLIGEEPYPLYARIRIGEVVTGQTMPEGLFLRGLQWFQQRGIELTTGRRCETVLVKEARVLLSDGESVPYDRLLLATGARPFVPPVPGAGLDGVFVLRTMEDALKLREAVQKAREAVVVGGGLLGLEAAVNFRTLGLSVRVIETGPYLLPRQLDRAGAEVVAGRLRDLGIEFEMAAQVQGILGTDRVTGVHLAGGEQLSADIVLIAAGVRPEVSLARAAGLDVNRGIVVDDFMQTSVPGVHAAGDCAEHRGRGYGIWTASEVQGRIAGANMAGSPVRYEGTLPSNTLRIADFAVFSIGDVDPEGKREVELSRDKGTYRKLVRDEEGRLVGAILVGDIKDRRAIQKAVEQRLPYRG